VSNEPSFHRTEDRPAWAAPGIPGMLKPHLLDFAAKNGQQTILETGETPF
jgi:hypothetical protein